MVIVYPSPFPRAYLRFYGRGSVSLQWQWSQAALQLLSWVWCFSQKRCSMAQRWGHHVPARNCAVYSDSLLRTLTSEETFRTMVHYIFQAMRVARALGPVSKGRLVLNSNPGSFLFLFKSIFSDNFLSLFRTFNQWILHKKLFKLSYLNSNFALTQTRTQKWEWYEKQTGK